MDAIAPTPLLIGAETGLEIETLAPIVEPGVVTVGAALPQPNVGAPHRRSQPRLTGPQSAAVAMALNDERSQGRSAQNEIDFRRDR